MPPEKSSDQTTDLPAIGEPPPPDGGGVGVGVGVAVGAGAGEPEVTVSRCDGRLCQAPPESCQKPKIVYVPARSDCRALVKRAPLGHIRTFEALPGKSRFLPAASRTPT